jgi:FkbM family methyltransferase
MENEMGTLLKAFFTRVNHCSACLPYNLNWRRTPKSVHAFLRANPLVVIDIGARGGGTGELEGLSSFVHHVGFDADDEECHRLMSTPPPEYAEFRVYPYYIGSSGPVDFNLYSNRIMSSTYAMNTEYTRAFGDPSERLDRTVRLQAIPLDEVAAKEKLAPPDLLKIDTQGSELDILRGSTNVLRETSLIEVEVEFYPMYEGQPVFSDLDPLLREEGFELLYLNRIFHHRKNFYRGLSKGQVICADALYGRSPSRLQDFSPERLSKYIILLNHYGHRDLANQIYVEHPEAAKVCPALKDCFPGPPSLLRVGLVLQLDKLICFLLHVGRSNHVMHDSDRSWPIR